MQEYPKEYIFPLEGEDHILAQVAVSPLKDKFLAEVQLVQKESRKIIKHLGSIYDAESEEEALDQGVSLLGTYLRS